MATGVPVSVEGVDLRKLLVPRDPVLKQALVNGLVVHATLSGDYRLILGTVSGDVMIGNLVALDLEFDEVGVLGVGV